MLNKKKTIAFLLNFIVVSVIVGAMGKIISIFVELESLFKMPIAWIVFDVIILISIIYLVISIKNENSVGMKISNKLVKDDDEVIKIKDIIIFIIILNLVCLLLGV